MIIFRELEVNSTCTASKISVRVNDSLQCSGLINMLMHGFPVTGSTKNIGSVTKFSLIIAVSTIGMERNGVEANFWWLRFVVFIEFHVQTERSSYNWRHGILPRLFAWNYNHAMVYLGVLLFELSTQICYPLSMGVPQYPENIQGSKTIILGEQCCYYTHGFCSRNAS